VPSLDVAEILQQRQREALALHERHVNPQFGRVLRTIGFDQAWVRGEGAHLIDADGERYLDLLGGYGVFAVGRNNPAVRAQLEAFLAADTASLPQMGVTTLSGVLAEELLRRAPDHLETVTFTNSGAEANEVALKFARASTGRGRIVHCDHGFHGLTLGALSVNGNADFRERFGPLLPGTTAVPYGDLDALAHALRDGDVAAFIVEAVQGKTVRVPDDAYLREAQALCRRHGTLLILDEVMTGLGRTGRFLALEHWGLEPDLVTLSKALSGGYVPIGAVLSTRQVHAAVFDSMERAVVHSSTFANGDFAAAAGIATLSALDDEGLVAHAERMGALLLELTQPLVERHDVVREVRGKGLMWAIELQPPSSGFARRGTWNLVERGQPGLWAQLLTVPLLARHRMLTQVSGHHVNVVRILPPLMIAEADIRRFAAALDDVLDGLRRPPRAVTQFALTIARHSARGRARAR
jgi:ornithine--oxo-acid transaminase